MIDYRHATSTTSSGCVPRAELSTRPDEAARHGRAVGSRRGGARAGAEAARDGVRRLAGRGDVLRAEDRPAHDGRPRPQLADGDDPARLPDAGALRPHVHGRRTTASTRPSSSTARCSARSSASSASSSSTTAGDFPFWLAPVQARVVPVGEAHREAPRCAPERLGREGFRARRRRARRDARQADPRRRAREAPVRRRLRRPRVRRGARRARARGRAGDGVARRARQRGSAALVAAADATQLERSCYHPRPASRSEQLPHLPGLTRGGSIEPKARRGMEPLLAAVLSSARRKQELVKSL